MVLTLPNLPLFPEAARGQTAIGITGVWCGDLVEGEAYTQPLRELGTPLVDLSGLWPYLALQSANDAFFPPHVQRHYWKSIDMPELTDAAIAQFAAHAATRSNPAEHPRDLGAAGDHQAPLRPGQSVPDECEYQP